MLMISVFFKTYGCLANTADSENLANFLRGLGCEIVTTESDADLILINSCAIREKAEHKLFSYIGRLLPYVKRKPHLKIGVIGCVASYRKRDFFELASYISFVFGAKDDIKVFRAYLVDVITNLETEKQFLLCPKATKDRFCVPKRLRDKDVQKIVDRKKLQVPRSVSDKVLHSDDRVKRAVVNIMTGCNNYCSYCIVPFVRGRERSFPMPEILDRIKKEIAAGVTEINLLGQNVNSYKDQETGAGFAKLLEQVAHLDGEFWIRFVSAHPKDMSIDVLDVMAAHPKKICPWVHLPLQAGSNKILKLMNRTYTVEQFIEQVGWIRERMPHATISTDIIVGFPGETEEDYQETRKVMEDVKFDFVFSFIFSPRKYTKAADMKDDCSPADKLERLEALQKRQKEISKEQNKKLIGKNFRVLIENPLRRGKGILFGKTASNIRVSVKSDDVSLVNKFIDVIVESAQETLVECSIREKIKEKLSDCV